MCSHTLFTGVWAFVVASVFAFYSLLFRGALNFLEFKKEQAERSNPNTIDRQIQPARLKFFLLAGNDFLIKFLTPLLPGNWDMRYSEHRSSDDRIAVELLNNRLTYIGVSSFVVKGVFGLLLFFKSFDPDTRAWLNFSTSSFAEAVPASTCLLMISIYNRRVLHAPRSAILFEQSEASTIMASLVQEKSEKAGVGQARK